MCGRYAVFSEEDIKEMRQILRDIDGQRHMGGTEMKTGEIFPTDKAPVIRLEGEKLSPMAMVWGFPKWQGSGVIINARSETAMEKSLFRTPLLTRRLIIPSTGFYEWTHPKGKTPKEKFLLRRADDPMLYMAGFYNLFKTPDGSYEERFVILTAAANESVSPLHDRMPVILDADEREAWLRDLSCVDKLMSRKGPALTLTKVSA